ncbi:MAG: restriction endonuclease subunit S [Imperialibacter sp.]|uniref:restriction endonuclease subunit S n=1 Tax=Imperialibacter sp. TaxID=2038411 RepID=UPI0032EBD60F
MKDPNIPLSESEKNTPDGWAHLRIKEIGKITSGTTPLRSNSLYHSHGSIPWVKTTDLNNSVILETEEKVTEIALKETSLRVYPKETVLVAMYGGFNQIGRTGILGIEATINQALSAITVNKDEIDPIFLLNWFNAKVGLWKNLAGSSRKDPNITSKDVGDFPFIKPPLPEQKAIAQALGVVDEAIQKNDQLITQKELRKKWLMQNLLTGKKRLKGFGGEWRECSYEKLLKVVRRPVKWDENKLYKLVSVRRRSGGIFFREALYGHQIKVKGLRTTEVGDFLFSKMQIVHGASALVTKEFEEAMISGSYIATIAKDPKLLNMEFFNWYSKLPYFYHQTLISSYGVHIEKMTFDFDTFLQLEMMLPSHQEQTAITQVLQAADQEIQLLRAKVEKLREQKKWMMQQLLTGKKRLRL